MDFSQFLKAEKPCLLFEHSESYCLYDCLNNVLVLTDKAAPQGISMMKNHSGLHAVTQALNQANIAPSFMGGRHITTDWH